MTAMPMRLPLRRFTAATPSCSPFCSRCSAGAFGSPPRARLARPAACCRIQSTARSSIWSTRAWMLRIVVVTWPATSPKPMKRARKSRITGMVRAMVRSTKLAAAAICPAAMAAIEFTTDSTRSRIWLMRWMKNWTVV